MWETNEKCKWHLGTLEGPVTHNQKGRSQWRYSEGRKQSSGFEGQYLQRTIGDDIITPAKQVVLKQPGVRCYWKSETASETQWIVQASHFENKIHALSWPCLLLHPYTLTPFWTTEQTYLLDFSTRAQCLIWVFVRLKLLITNTIDWAAATQCTFPSDSTNTLFPSLGLQLS